MRSYPCEITGEPATSDAAGLQRQVHEGDEITLERPSDKAGQPSPVACFHGGRFIGHIPEGRPWVRRSLLEGDRHQVRVTGFDTNEAGEIACVEIEITILNDETPNPDPDARSVISEIGDELRILAMVAAADGRIAASERGLLEQFADRRAREMGIDPQDGEAAHAVRWAGRKAADSLDAARIIGRLAIDRPSILPIMLDECELMAEIDGTVGYEERQVVTTLRNLLQHGLKVARDNSA